MSVPYTMPAEQNLQAIRVYYPHTNNYVSTLFDADTKMAVGFDPETPFAAETGSSMIHDVVEGDEEGNRGIVPGSSVWGFAVRHLYDDVYRLEKASAENTVYRMSRCGAGSDRFGKCEVCAKEVDSTYRLTSMRTYTRHDGSMGLTHHNGIDKFGHKDCLAQLTEPATH